MAAGIYFRMEISFEFYFAVVRRDHVVKAYALRAGLSVLAPSLAKVPMASEISSQAK